MKTINYSFIIPHKNSCELLKRCLDSIPQRDDIQIIVVDDNSDDTTSLRSIIESRPLAELHLTTENRGAGYARNIGLEQTKGKWVLFADADDFFHPELTKVLEEYKNCNYDIVFFNTDSCYSENLQTAPNRCKEIEKGIYNKNLESLKWKVHVVWGKMYSANFIRNNKICFDEVIASNDVMFVCKANYYANNVIIDDTIIYCSTINLNSLCYKINFKNLESRYKVGLRHNFFMHQIKKEKYQINLLSLVLYYKKIGFKSFANKIVQYLNNTTLYMKWIDLILSIQGLLNFKQGNRTRKHQRIEAN